MNKKKCTYIIGFMGAGKSSIGRLLAKRLGYAFIDTDSIIEEQEGMTIGEIFENKGEGYFRETEKKLLRKLTLKHKEDGFVMSTGGGMPCNPESLNYMMQNGKLIYIKSDIDDIIERVKDNKTRPIINRLKKKTDVKKALQALLKKREIYYMKADITVFNNKRCNPEDIVKMIEEKLGE